MANIWKLKSTNRVPPSGAYSYTQKETGVTLRHHNLPTLHNLIKKHRQANKIKVDVEFEFEVEQSICEGLINSGHPNLCQEVVSGGETSGIISFMESKGASWVDEEALQRRIDTCMGNKDKNIVRCPKWIEATDSCRGCQSCGSRNKLLELNRKIVSTRCPLNKWR